MTVTDLTDYARLAKCDADGNPRHYVTRARGREIDGHRRSVYIELLPVVVDDGYYLTDMEPSFAEMIGTLAAVPWDMATVEWQTFWWSSAEKETDRHAWANLAERTDDAG